MTDRFTHDAGSYVLGALSPEDRRAFEEHLAGCADCRAEVQEFAGLPGLLSRLPAWELPGQDAAEPVPPSMLPALLDRTGLERRSRRRRAVLAGIAAVFVAAAGSAALAQTLDDRPAAVSAQRAMAFTPVSAAIPASAEATLTDVPGGTRIDMTCRYEGTVDDRDREYRLRLVSRGRPPEWLGSWPVLTGDDYRMVVVAPLPRADIDLLEVVSATGRSLLTLRP